MFKIKLDNDEIVYANEIRILDDTLICTINKEYYDVFELNIKDIVEIKIKDVNNGIS